MRANSSFILGRVCRLADVRRLLSQFFLLLDQVALNERIVFAPKFNCHRKKSLKTSVNFNTPLGLIMVALVFLHESQCIVFPCCVKVWVAILFQYNKLWYYFYNDVFLACVSVHELKLSSLPVYSYYCTLYLVCSVNTTKLGGECWKKRNIFYPYSDCTLWGGERVFEEQFKIFLDTNFIITC